MIIGERIRVLREEKKMTRGDVQERTGLQRTYIWRVENGYTIPAIETLEKFARGMDVPIYRFFYEGKGAPPLVPVTSDTGLWGGDGEEKKTLRRFQRCLGQMGEPERSLLMYLAEEMARRTGEGREGRPENKKKQPEK